VPTRKRDTDLPTPAELADTLNACAAAMTQACAALADAGDQRGVRALQAAEPAVRNAGTVLAAHADDVSEALRRASHEVEDTGER
jgi:hypothetical protein